ncbi:ABC transporter, permease protein [Acidisarcina polymorpha]|uniref:ABC transporter, permease protein n=1 Tax=Acidisarcina polymorpha TaxID=2211140 RepID=A0A2Z5FUD6_9BACT|nr:ABC transporter permease [Acidisarcina polymorpha]AXC10117.1 ABC transporter, permease protein [Acidisarcina polymorpha]
MISRVRALWKNAFRRKQLDRDLDEELEAYMKLVEAEKLQEGMAPEEAYAYARRQTGGTDHVVQNVRDVRTGAWIERFVQDVRYGIRSLANNPTFSLVAVGTLALGIGANTAMFSLLDQVVLRLLPVRDPKQLVIVKEAGNHYGNSYGPNTMSWPMFEDLRDNNNVFSAMFCRFPTHVTIGYSDQTVQISAELVSSTYFQTLGVEAVLGRTISHDDDSIPDSAPVVVLSYSFWQSYFNGDRNMIGRTIALNGQAMTVIGVAQPGFDGVEMGEPAKIFVPIMMKTEMTPHSDGLKDRRRRLSWVTTYGRLRPGMNTEQAQASLQPLLHSILEMEVQQPEFIRSATAADREPFLRNRIELLPGSDNDLREYMSRPLWVLLALTAAVLLLACANLANLLLARATTREKEFAVRLAIGAGRARIVRQLLVESLLLSGSGAVVGLMLAYAADRILLRIYLPADAASEFAVSPIPDGRMLAFTLGAMLLTSLVFGLLPAMRASRTEITLALKDRSGAASTGGMSLRRLLVSIQMALSLLLLVGAGLFVRTLRNLEDVGPGFPTDHLLTFTTAPTLSGYSFADTKSYYDRLKVDLEAMPGVTSIAFSTMPVLRGYAWQNAIVGKDFEGTPIEQQPVLSQVDPNYFATLGIPVIAGRAFSAQDVAPTDYAVVNESFAREYFPGRNPLGQRFGLVSDSESVPPKTEVIGVIPDRKYRDLKETPPPQAYFPYLAVSNVRGMTVYVRTQGDPRQFEDALRERMHRFDPHVPAVDLQTVNEQIGFSLRTERLVASLSAVFGCFAMVLAVIGLYGVMAYTVLRRTREIGIRIALGALRSNVIAMIMCDVLLLIGSGLAAGVTLALVLVNLIRSQLYGLNARDPLTFISSAIILALAAGFAGFIPAVRASGVDPTIALRQE